jgi:predicted enzyme related to lactoylglutathione lyase
LLSRGGAQSCGARRGRGQLRQYPPLVFAGEARRLKPALDAWPAAQQRGDDRRTIMVTVHVYIEVTEATRGIDFYCQGLGLTLKRRLSRTWFELAGADVPIFLLADRPPLADLGSRMAPRDYERHWTPVHLDFIVDDLDATVSRLVAMGASLDRNIKLREYGRIANMADPFGNGFDLIEFSGSGYDAVSR